MKAKPYKAKSLSGAQARVRLQEKRIGDLVRWLRMADEREKKLKRELQLLAKLSATGPCFYNPLVAFEAQAVRDRVLKELGLNPDGSRIEQPTPA